VLVNNDGVVDVGPVERARWNIGGPPFVNGLDGGDGAGLADALCVPCV
jgi:hypothetical protein